MSTKSFPYNGGTGNNVTNNDWIDMVGAIMNDGVILGALNAFAVTAGSGMTVNVASGRSFIRGTMYEETTGPINLAIATADNVNPRIDLVVAHQDITGQGAGSLLKVLTGTPAPSPVAPSPTQTAYTTWELPLATVLVPANAASSASFTITDKRVYASASVQNLVSLFSDGGNITSDGTGVLKVKNILQLAGVAETGKTGGTWYGTGTGVNVGSCTNFKRQMVNSPSSITLSPGFTSNAGSTSGTAIDVYGFNLQVAAGSTGEVTWQGNYTTVGNCLRAVRRSRFDIHCDGCEETNPRIALKRGRLLKRDLRIVEMYNELKRRMEYALSHDCPDCGTIESFNTMLSSADERLRIPGWERRMEQAYLVRQAMEALKLPVAA